VGTRAGLDRCGKSRPHRDSILGPSSPQPVAIPTELPGPSLIPYDLVKSAMGKETVLCVISGLCRHVDENCGLLGYYAASNGNYLQSFRDNLSVPSSKVKNRRRPTDRSSPNVGKEVPLPGP
jgi:hypothetical protein